jgi:hypothetical protein
MTSMEQIEYIAVEARKMGISFDEWRVRYGHTLPKPEPTKYKEHEWYEGMDHKEYSPRKKIEVICQNPECGAPFLTTRKNARLCPVCAKERQRKLMAERNRKRRMEAKKND